MEGDADRGFERLLTQLDDATRSRYCAQALDDELDNVLAQFQQCTQAMDHARQVDEATRSLVANASSAIRMGSATVTQSLSELQALYKALAKSVRSLKGSTESTTCERVIAETMDEGVREEENEEEEEEEEGERREGIRLLEKTRSLLIKQRRSTWLADAVETARRAVRLMAARVDEAETTRDATATAFAAPDRRIYRVFKLLRKCVLKDAATHTELLPVARKLLKRLRKKRPVLAAFVEKSDELLAAKEAQVLQGAEPPPPVDAKKRCLAATTQPTPTEASTTSEDVKIKIEPQANGASRATLDVRSKMRLCALKTTALQDTTGFSLVAFDVCLKMMIEVVNALTPQLTGEDTAIVSSTLVSLVDRARDIDVLDQRTDRLRCLEGLLGMLVRAERLKWSSAHAKVTVVACQTECRRVLAMSTSSETQPQANGPAKRRKKDKVAGSHVRFGADE